MRIVERITDLDLPSNLTIGFVPTMGAFHTGHLQLMQRAKEKTQFSVASLFVNPLQFGPNEDYSKYPRSLELDSKQAEAVGIDVLFAPTVEQMYNGPTTTKVQVPGLTDIWEGAQRPGHFDGVTTVVAKLFHIVQPTIAYFGRKDFQQCAVISKMVRDLNFRTAVSIEPTVREEDGLAMSSRNRYLSDSERLLAPIIYQTLSACRERIVVGGGVDEILQDAVNLLTKSGIKVQYFAYVENESLAPANLCRENSSIIFAGLLGSTRLIDNIAVL